MAKKMDKNTLLVAVDFTSFSEKALVFASELAEKLEARLLVLHVIHDPAEAPGFYAQKGKKKKFLQSMEETAEEMMERFLKKMRKAYPGRMPIKEAIPLLRSHTAFSGWHTRYADFGNRKKETGPHDYHRQSWTYRVIPFAGGFKGRTGCTTISHSGNGC
jgi:hypothetical protein